jgi:sec-independent protein translocase protein TatB
VFNVGIGEIAVIIVVCLLVFGPDRLPEMARQVGRFLGQLRLNTQGALDQLKSEAELKDVPLPDLRVGSLRSQARDYLAQLMDIEGQMAELERERAELKRSLQGEIADAKAQVNGNGSATAASIAEAEPASNPQPVAWEAAPIDPEAT